MPGRVMGHIVPLPRAAADVTVITSWQDALDAIEERLRRLERVVAGETDDVPTLDIAVPGPVPDELVPRALVLVARSRLLEERAARAFAGQGRAAVAYGRSLRQIE